MTTMQTEYRREINQNYLIICQSDEEEIDHFQSKMLMTQKWNHLAACTENVINGKNVFYYDINSIISLPGYYGARKMRKDDIVRLIRQLEEAIEELSEYLMDEGNILFAPEYIYFDMGKKEYRFIYYPESQHDNRSAGERITPLLDFILEKTDDGDSEATELIYDIYDKATEENFIISKILDENDDDETESSIDRTIKYSQSEQETDYDMQDEVTCNIETETSKKKEGGKKFIITGIAAAACLAGPALVFLMYELTAKEKLILCGASAVMVFTSVCFISMYFKEKKSNALSEENKDDTSARKMKDNAPQYKNDEQGMFRSEYEYMDRAAFDKANTDDTGKTEFFQPVKELEQYKLYASDRKNSQHIGLEKLPCIIGQQPECVDKCIKGKGISRIHARLDHNGVCFTVTDLNSTNGTFVNGVPLEPNETMELSEGDEIRFGDLNYCLR